MEKIIYKGKLANAFYGFNEDAIFKMSNGTYWIQKRYKYWYHYAYRPEVEILYNNGAYMLNVAGRSIEVRQVHDVVESAIDGDFNGWEGESSYKLINGQVWKQCQYKYEYHYAYRPDVLIYSANGSYVMAVEGTRAYVRRER